MNVILYIFIIILGLGNVFQYYKMKKGINEQRSLNEEVNLYKSIFSTLPVAIFVHSRLKFVFVNKAGAKIFETENPKELIGKHLSDFIQINVDAVGEERLENALEDKPFEVLVEESLTSKDGKVIAVEMISMPMKLRGKTVVLNLTRDINHVKELEKLKRKVDEEKQRLEEVIEYDKLKTEFFSNLSHELRTPLTLILGVVMKESKKENHVERINIEFSDIYS